MPNGGQMNYDKQIEQLRDEAISLHAETSALSTLLFTVLLELRFLGDPRIKDAIGRALNNAASHLENFAIKTGEAASPEHTVKALKIVEDMRAQLFGGQGKPSGIV
jgi:hypothetical protein